jgi:hypothetical protein
MSILCSFVCLCSFIVNVNAQTNLPIFRAPPISVSLSSNMTVWETIASSQTYPKHLISQEGERSDPYSSAQGLKDYFVVYIPSLTNHGTILTMDPLRTSYNGVQTFPVHFRDVISNVDYYVTFDYATLTGTFTVCGQKIWMKISYDPNLTPRYPFVQLTLGNQASFGDVGTVYDDFRFAVVETSTPPTVMQLAIVHAIGITNVPNGMYIAVNAPDEHYTLQSTTDFKSWADEPVPFYIFGYIGIHYYPAADVVIGNKFFRSKR